MKKISIKNIIKSANELDMMGHVEHADLLDGVVGLLLGGSASNENSIVIIDDEIEGLGQDIGDSLYEESFCFVSYCF